MPRLRLQPTVLVCLSLLSFVVLAAHARVSGAPAADEPATAEYYVRVKSTVPAIAGQITPIYVRERAMASGARQPAALADRVILFIHGAGTPAEVAYDVPYQDYSWMAYLAKAGFDVFAMDQTGYGRSARPFPMNDPCNLSAAQQAQFVPSLIPAPCTASYGQQATTLASDWNDIDGVVDYIRALRSVARIHLVGWSLGGPRAAGYAAQHADKINKVVLLAPAYSPNASATAPATVPGNGAAFNTQTRADFDANWDRQIGCPGQVDPQARETVWTNMLDSDPVARTWGPGARRAPNTTTWGWNAAMAAQLKSPTLLVSGAHDAQVSPAGVMRLHSDLGAASKVFVDLACSSHNALWEHNHLLLFQASREWFEKTTVNGQQSGVLKIGY